MVDVIDCNWLSHPAPLGPLNDGVVYLLILCKRIILRRNAPLGYRGCNSFHHLLLTHDFPEYFPELSVVMLLKCFG